MKELSTSRSKNTRQATSPHPYYTRQPWHPCSWYSSVMSDCFYPVTCPICESKREVSSLPKSWSSRFWKSLTTTTPVFHIRCMGRLLCLLLWEPIPSNDLPSTGISHSLSSPNWSARVLQSAMVRGSRVSSRSPRFDCQDRKRQWSTTAYLTLPTTSL